MKMPFDWTSYVAIVFSQHNNDSYIKVEHFYSARLFLDEKIDSLVIASKLYICVETKPFSTKHKTKV